NFRRHRIALDIDLFDEVNFERSSEEIKGNLKCFSKISCSA
ncbi:hypothetical protein TSMEX_000039, partial [Taenia solium]